MPVRIYEIAKKLNLESKFVLNKAKELGIAAAKVPSSTLDKITAEFLEEQLAPLAKPLEPTKPVEVTPVTIIHAPPPPPLEPEPAPAPAPPAVPAWVPEPVVAIPSAVVEPARPVVVSETEVAPIPPAPVSHPADHAPDSAIKVPAAKAPEEGDERPIPSEPSRVEPPATSPISAEVVQPDPDRVPGVVLEYFERDRALGLGEPGPDPGAARRLAGVAGGRLGQRPDPRSRLVRGDLAGADRGAGPDHQRHRDQIPRRTPAFAGRVDLG